MMKYYHESSIAYSVNHAECNPLMNFFQKLRYTNIIINSKIIHNNILCMIIRHFGELIQLI